MRRRKQPTIKVILRTPELFCADYDELIFEDLFEDEPQRYAECLQLIQQIDAGARQCREMCELRPAKAEKFKAQHNLAAQTVALRVARLSNCCRCSLCGRWYRDDFYAPSYGRCPWCAS